jgi:tetratricopeptide (TPR) repeat protein
MRLKTTLILMSLFLTMPFVRAQDQHVIDSIMSLIKNDGSRSDMEIFYELGFQHATTNATLSKSYLGKSLELALKHGDSLKIVKCNRMKGQVLRRMGNQDEALAVFENILPMSKRLGIKEETGYMLRGMGAISNHMGHMHKALEYNFQELALWREINDFEEISTTLNGIGLVHYKIGNYDKAVEYYNEALTLAKDKNLSSVPLIYANIGMASIPKGNLIQAQQWLERGLAICKPNCSPYVHVVSEFGLGYVALHSEELIKADSHFHRSYKIAEETNDYRFQAENLVSMASVHRLQRKYSTAEEFLKMSLELCQKSNYRNLLSDTYLEFFELYKALGQPEKAGLFLEQYVNLLDSINSSEARNRIMVAQTEFEHKENKLIIAHNQELLSEQKNQTRLVVAVCILSIICSIGLFVILRNKQRSNRILDRRVTERTRELEANKASLERAFLEQNELLTKASQSIRKTIASQKGINTPIVLESGAIDFSHTQKIQDELSHVAESLANARSIQKSANEKT